MMYVFHCSALVQFCECPIQFVFHPLFSSCYWGLDHDSADLANYPNMYKEPVSECLP